MRATVALLLMLLAGPAWTAEPRTYAVLSLIGDKLMVVRFQIGTGSRLDGNVRASFGTPGGEMDRIMAFSIEDAIRKADPAAKVVLLIANDPAIYAAQSPAGASSVPTVLPALQEMLAGAKATHLVLVTKLRAEAKIPLDDGSVGRGWLEGLGFYIDDELRLLKREGGEASEGLLAPFGYARFSLVDLGSSRVVRELAVTRAIAAVNQRSASTWENLSGEEKARMLQSIVRSAAAEAVPTLLSP
jgi:hypothetical protein